MPCLYRKMGTYARANPLVMRTYYQLLNLPPKATSLEVEAAFRRFVANHRVTYTTEQIFDDPTFQNYLNAYLTLRGPLRTRYDELLRQSETPVTPPTPLEDYPHQERGLLMANRAYWRGEIVGAIHLLRAMVNHDPQYAPGWALMGEVYCSSDHFEEGIAAFERAAAADPTHTAYAARLQHAHDAAVGKVLFKRELTPTEEIEREVRHKRRLLMMLLGIFALATVVYAVMAPLHPAPGSLYLPWRSVLLEAAGLFVFMMALGYGRLLEPYERVMLFSSMSAHDRGWERRYPFGLILFVTGATSLWLSVAALIVMAITDDECPISPVIMLSCCVLANLALSGMMIYHYPEHWTGTFFIGGNFLIVAAMLGWWIGTYGTDISTL